MKLTIQLNDQKAYLNDLLTPELKEKIKTYFSDMTTGIELSNTLVLKKEGLHVSFNQSLSVTWAADVSIAKDDKKGIIQLIEKALFTYQGLRKFQRAFAFPYEFTCYVQREDFEVFSEALRQKGITFEVAPSLDSDVIYFTIFHKTYLYQR